MTETEFIIAFKKLDLEHFKAKEFLYKGDSNSGTGRCAGLNDEPFPAFALENLLKLAPVWDRIRSEFGHPIRLVSLYRSPKYNLCVGGVANSQHKRGNAGDGYPLKGTANDLYKAALKVRSSGFFKGGVGAYNTFVHVDVEGTNRNWDSRTN